MRLYLDQMFGAALADLLRAEGHDVMRASEAGQARADDSEILQEACQTERTLVTLDDHFGDWAVLPLSLHPGVIRLKIHPTTTRNAAELLIPFLATAEETKLCNHLVIVSKARIRWVRTGSD